MFDEQERHCLFNDFVIAKSTLDSQESQSLHGVLNRTITRHGRHDCQGMIVILDSTSSL